MKHEARKVKKIERIAHNSHLLDTSLALMALARLDLLLTMQEVMLRGLARRGLFAL